MKIVHISSSDIQGGAARAAYRLNQALNRLDIDSRMFVRTKKGDDLTVSFPNTSKSIYDNSIPSLNFYLERYPVPFSTGREGVDISNDSLIKDAEIINLHWINGDFLSLKSLNKLERLNKPIVWTLHDMWPFTGGCHYSNFCDRYQEKCGRCPILKSDQEEDLTRKVWLKKHEIFNKLDLTIVTPSKWLAESARESSLFSDSEIKVIPNTLDTGIFKPIDKKVARMILNLPMDKHLVLFGAVKATKDKRKGFTYLKEALEKLSFRRKDFNNNLELLVFGASSSEEMESFPYKVNFMGTLKDDYTLALCYSAADVFIAPSLEDNLPNTVMESMACGTPVVAFNIGGMPDMLEHKKNGYLAEYKSAEDLAEGIGWILKDERRLKVLGKETREKVINNYSFRIVGKKYLNLYEELLTRDIEVKKWSEVYGLLKWNNLKKYVGYFDINKAPNIKDVRQIMNQVWYDIGLETENISEEDLDIFQSHPIWLFYSLFIETEPTSMYHINLIADYFKDKKNLNILVYNDSIGTVAKEIAKRTPSSNIDIYKSNIFDYIFENIKGYQNISFVNTLKDNYYDVLVSNNIFEYVKDPVQLAARLNGLLKKEGVLISDWDFDSDIAFNLTGNFHFKYTFENIVSTLGFSKNQDLLNYGYRFIKENDVSQKDLDQAYKKEDRSKRMYSFNEKNSFIFADQFIDFILEDNNKRVAIFGSGELGKLVFNLIQEASENVAVEYFFDNDKFKWNRSLFGKMVLKPELELCNKVDKIIIASIYGKDAIKEQLLGMGIDERKVLTIYE
ncbi:MAG: hypothetical protein PWR10_647 [Halanaerobiales bacterium]|nr:hypothetical protein [Halanaerobiales bacterium]